MLVLSFIIQVAVYTRQDLNIRITANFLLALAASQPSTKPHVRRYFCAAVQLPSDWLEVVRIFSTVSFSERLLCGGVRTNQFCQFCPVLTLCTVFPVLQPLPANVPEEGDG